MAEKGSAVLFERQEELARIAALLDETEQARGRCIIAEGQAGIGKSALLTAGVELARARGHRALVARGTELERDFGYGIVRQLTDPLIRHASREELDVLFGGAAALAAPVVSPDESGHAPPVGPDAPFAAQHGLYWLVDNIALTAPLQIVVDDAQWADPASLRFLLYLVRRLEGLPVGVLVGWRTGEPGAPLELLQALLDEPLVETISPAALSPRATEQLIRTRMSQAPEPQFSLACHETTGGNPFLVTELLAAVAQMSAESRSRSPRGPSSWPAQGRCCAPAPSRTCRSGASSTSRSAAPWCSTAFLVIGAYVP